MQAIGGLPTYFQVTKWLHKDSSEYFKVSQPERCLHKSLKLGTHYHVDLTFLYFSLKIEWHNLVTLRIDNSFSMFVVTLTRIDNSFSMFVVTLTRIDNSFQVQVQVPLTKHTFTMPFRT